MSEPGRRFRSPRPGAVVRPALDPLPPTGAPSRLGTRMRRALPWLFGIVAFAIAAKKLIGGYGDLGIYLDVAREFREGGHDLCRARESSGPWVYPPCAALPFVLLEGLLGDTGARWSWCGLLGVATALLLRALAGIARATRPLHWWQWLVFAVLFQRCIAQNLSHGQLDYLLQPRPADGDGHTVNVLDVSDGTLATVKALWAAGLLALLGAWFLAARRLPTNHGLAERCAVVTMAMAWFSPLVRTYHLAAMLPAALLFCRGPRRGPHGQRPDALWYGVAIALLLCLTMRQRNLLGDDLWRWLDLGGLLHFTLVAMVVWTWREAGKNASQQLD